MSQPSRQQKRAKDQQDLITAVRVVVYTNKGHAIEMDVEKIDILARDTGKPLFKHVDEGQVIEADVVQDGNWAGIRYKSKE